MPAKDTCKNGERGRFHASLIDARTLVKYKQFDCVVPVFASRVKENEKCKNPCSLDRNA